MSKTTHASEAEKKRSRKSSRGPLGDAIPKKSDPDPRTVGGRPQEKVEDRPGVSQVNPDDYPDAFKAKG